MNERGTDNATKFEAELARTDGVASKEKGSKPHEQGSVPVGITTSCPTTPQLYGTVEKPPEIQHGLRGPGYGHENTPSVIPTTLGLATGGIEPGRSGGR